MKFRCALRCLLVITLLLQNTGGMWSLAFGSGSVHCQHAHAPATEHARTCACCPGGTDLSACDHHCAPSSALGWPVAMAVSVIGDDVRAAFAPLPIGSRAAPPLRPPIA